MPIHTHTVDYFCINSTISLINCSDLINAKVFPEPSGGCTAGLNFLEANFFLLSALG